MTDNNASDIPNFLDRRPPAEPSKPTDVVDQPEPDVPSQVDADNTETNAMLPHPYADLFPMMKGEAFRELVASVRDHGLETPITTYEGKILDGRNRSLACSNAQVKKVYVEYDGDDPLGFVMRANLTRRHLTASQRAIVAAKMANLKSGEQIDKPLLDSSSGSRDPLQNSNKPQDQHQRSEPEAPQDARISTEQAAAALDVSPSSVKRAKKVLASGDDDLIEAMESGEVPVAAAAKQIEQADAVPAETTPTPNSIGEVECQRLLRLWNKTGEEGRALFKEAIGVGRLAEAVSTDGPKH